MKTIQSILLALLVSLTPNHAKETENKPPAKKKRDTSFEYRFDDDLQQTPDSIELQNQWFRDAKFGIFIHFGVYSSLEGEYDGRGSHHRYSEWIQLAAKIPAPEYRKIAAQFNPVDFDADEWAKVFKDSGARYVVITSKHHDGFSLFDSMVSDYNIVDHTPFKRDIIKELNEACHRQGLKFGVYYSHAQDWDEPDAPYLNKKLAKLKQIHPNLPKDYVQDMDRYLAKKSLPQVEELVKNYDLDLIWFDTAVNMTFERAKPFYEMVRKHRPNCLINSRIIQSGKDKVLKENLELFDYISIGDKEVPDRKLPLYVESPDSVSSSFGYKTKGNYFYHSEEEMIHRMVHTVCAGGNSLINNGPMGNGKLDPEAIRLYGVIGEWLKVHGEAIYKANRNPLPTKPEWGDCSVSEDGKSLYLHILKWPESKTITVSGLNSTASASTFLVNGEAADFVQEGDTLKITLPTAPLNAYNTVVKVTFPDSVGE